MEGGDAVVFTPMRAAIARRMALSQSTIPQFSVSIEVEMDAAFDELRRQNAVRHGQSKLTLTALVIKALASALETNGSFNAVWDGDTLFEMRTINVAVAIALDDGLIAPAILDCARLEVAEISEALRDLIARARDGRLRLAEFQAGTITISNLGMFDVPSFTAIVTSPQVAVLATGRTVARAVVVDGEIKIRQMMVATLSADHRAVDGAAAARLLASFRDWLRSPASLTAAPA